MFNSRIYLWISTALNWSSHWRRLWHPLTPSSGSACFLRWLQQAVFEGPALALSSFFNLGWHVVHWLHWASLSPNLIYICIFILKEIRNLLVDKYWILFCLRFSVSFSKYIYYIYIFYRYYHREMARMHTYAHIQTQIHSHAPTSASNKWLVYIYIYIYIYTICWMLFSKASYITVSVQTLLALVRIKPSTLAVSRPHS